MKLCGICEIQLLHHTATTAPTSLAPMLAGLSQFHTAFPAQPSCVDKHQQCPNWAFAGQCELNQGFMKVQCAQSCDSCGWGPELTRTPRGLRWVRTGYAYQSPALGTYRRRRAACLQGSACCKYWVHVPRLWRTQVGTGHALASRAPGRTRRRGAADADPRCRHLRGRACRRSAVGCGPCDGCFDLLPQPQGCRACPV